MLRHSLKESQTKLDQLILVLKDNIRLQTISAKKKTESLDNIAELSGWTPKEIAENIGMSYNWVAKYLSDKYKMVSKQRFATQHVTSELENHVTKKRHVTKEPHVAKKRHVAKKHHVTKELKDVNVGAYRLYATATFIAFMLVIAVFALACIF